MCRSALVRERESHERDCSLRLAAVCCYDDLSGDHLDACDVEQHDVLLCCGLCVQPVRFVVAQVERPAIDERCVKIAVSCRSEESFEFVKQRPESSGL